MNKSYHRSISSSETSPVISEAGQGDFMVTVHPGEDDASNLLRSTEKVKDFVSKHLPGSLLMDDRLVSSVQSIIFSYITLFLCLVQAKF